MRPEIPDTDGTHDSRSGSPATEEAERWEFLFRSRPHPGGPGMACISSGAETAKTCRQDVLRGVDVPAVPGTAGSGMPGSAGCWATSLRADVRSDRRLGWRYHLSITIRCRPARPHLSSSWRLEIAATRQSEMVLGRRPVGGRGIVTGQGRSMTIKSWSGSTGSLFAVPVVRDGSPAGARLGPRPAPVGVPVTILGAEATDFPVGASDLRPGLGPVRGPFLAAGEPALDNGRGPVPGPVPPPGTEG